MRLSLRIQQTALFVAVILLAVLILSSWVYAELRGQLTASTRADLIQDASAVSGVIGPFFPQNAENLRELRDHVRQFSEILGDDVRVYDTEGRLIDSRTSLSVPREALERASRGGLSDEGFADVSLSGDGVVMASTPIYDPSGHKAGVAIVANTAAEARGLLRTLREQLAVAAVVTIVIAGLLGLLFSEIITRQTKNLISAADAIAAGDFSRRMPPNLLPDEIRTLVEAFNRMAEQLGDAFDALRGQEAAQREFVSNASHELRTPIAALKGAIEILEEGAKEHPEVRDEFLGTMRVEVNRLQRLVDNLFTLAQVDAGRLRLRLRPESASEIVRVVASSMGPLANEAGVAIQSDLSAEETGVLCDRDYVTQVLIGFVDNAVKHTPAGGIVTISARPNGDAVRFCVTDTGSGIPEDVLPHVFDRFFTQRKAAEGPRRGSGLGLAIAHEIIEAHASEIEVSSRTGEGTSFCFSLRSASLAS